MDTNELKQKIGELLNECPERKEGAAKAAESEAKSLIKSFISKIKNADDWCDY